MATPRATSQRTVGRATQWSSSRSSTCKSPAWSASSSLWRFNGLWSCSGGTASIADTIERSGSAHAPPTSSSRLRRRAPALLAQIHPRHRLLSSPSPKACCGRNGPMIALGTLGPPHLPLAGSEPPSATSLPCRAVRRSSSRAASSSQASLAPRCASSPPHRVAAAPIASPCLSLRLCASRLFSSSPS